MPNFRNIEIPKFTSYKPKSTLQPQIHIESKTSNESKTKTRTRHKQIGRRTAENYNDDRTNSRKSSSKKSNLQSEHLNDSSYDSFVIDRKGDQNNLIYGSLHKYSIPKYYRYGAGRVLGAPLNLKINRELGDDKWIELSQSGLYENQTREKYIFSKVERQKPVVIKAEPQLLDKERITAEFDFISFYSNQNRSRYNNEETSDDENSTSKFETHDSYSDYVSGKQNLELHASQYIDENLTNRRKNATLRMRVENSPTDIEAWLLLINHQDLLIEKSDDPLRISQASIKSIADIKVHLYEKALQHCKSLENRERLLVGLMSEGEKLWELKIQANRWEHISKNNIDSLFLWKKYLNFKQFNLSTFRYEEVKKLYLQRIEYLNETIKTDPKYTEKNCRELLFVLLRATIFIREAGYSELAVAIWQSNLEINFCAPREEYKYDECINIFREFWESEVPRIGEIGAKGWRYYEENPDAISAINISEDKDGDLLEKSNIFKSWAFAERLRSRSSKIPAKTLDEVVDDDPFRVILFTDIQDFICFLPSKSEKTYRFFIDAFLSFCSLSPLVNFDDDQKYDYNDIFNIDSFVESEHMWLESDCSSDKKDTKCGNQDATIAPTPNFVSSSDSLFYDITKLHETLRPYRARFPEDTGPVTYNFVRNSLSQLIHNFNDSALAEYYLSFEYKNEPDTIKKISKALLKQNSSDLRLYNAYALIEWSSGNKKVAEGVFSAALNISDSNARNFTDGKIILLWKSWIWTCLEDRDNFKALRYLICIADGQPNLNFDIHPTVLLRTKQYLTLKQDYFMSINSVIAVMYSECLALLEYLSSFPRQDTSLELQGNIKNALKLYTSISQILHENKQRKSHEILLQSASRLLFYHCRCGSYSPAFVREYLSDFLQKFPQNTIFISFYSWNESRLRIDDRVRYLLLKNVLLPQNDSLTSRLFAIRYEIKIGNIHSTKAAFEDSVSSPIMRNSPGLWQLYILYCLRIPQFQCDAKSVWLRAIRNCPSVKKIYTLGFEKLGECMEYLELKRIWKTMEEKELRIHINLEDEFDEIEKSV
ncbi:Nuclear exosome regulator NRDE2 [Erysiphe necator]|nr:Nuclear exosome regulator NRDE2 [Erysiphe necator]